MIAATGLNIRRHHRGGMEIVGRDIQDALVGPWSRSISEGKRASPQLPISAKPPPSTISALTIGSGRDAPPIIR
jgi:hypothetical protein